MTKQLNSTTNNGASSNGNSPSNRNRPASSGGFSRVDSPSKMKKKKEQPVYNIEEIFNQVSSSNISNLNAPIGKTVLTPRSSEACLKLGVNAEILKVRDIDSFYEGGVEPVIQRMRHEAYVQRRHDTMKQCRIERKRITNTMFETSDTADTPGRGEIQSMEVLLQKHKAQSSSMMQMEMQKIAKMQQRQEKELEQMIQVSMNITVDRRKRHISRLFF